MWRYIYIQNGAILESPPLLRYLLDPGDPKPPLKSQFSKAEEPRDQLPNDNLIKNSPVLLKLCPVVQTRINSSFLISLHALIPLKIVAPSGLIK